MKTKRLITILFLTLLCVACKSSLHSPKVIKSDDHTSVDSPTTPSQSTQTKLTIEECKSLFEKLLKIKVNSLTEEQQSQLDESDMEAIRHGLKPYEKECEGSVSKNVECLENSKTSQDVERCLGSSLNQFPLNSAFLFSANALSPSFRSSVKSVTS